MKPVPFPKTIWVGGYEFPMALVGVADPRLDGDDGAFESAGDFRGIVVCESLGTYRTIEVALHEVTHAINWSHDVFNEIDDTAEEEAATTKQGAAWARVYVDNPQFCRWLNYAVNLVRKERKTA